MSSFLLAFVLASIAAVALGLLLQRITRDAATRHAILLASLLLPPVLVVTTFAGVRLPASSAAATGLVEFVIGPATAARIDRTLPAILGVLWLAGALIALARIIVEASRWRGVAARAERIGDPAMLRRFERMRTAAVSAADAWASRPRTRASETLARQPARTPAVRCVLARSAVVSEPTVIGIVAPIVVLPAAYELEPAELDAVFAHELAHIARLDNLTALAVQLVCAAFWFDPLHRIARRKLIELRERVCDDIVLDRGCDAEAYANALARSCETSFHAPAVACMSRLKLHERMESIMTYETRRHSPAWIRRTVAGITVAAAAVVFATFAPAPSMSAGETKTKEAQNVTRPRPIRTSNAVYTEEARKNHVEGNCVVEVSVDVEGDVIGTRIVESLPHGLDQAAIDAIRTWKFEPATRDGKPVAAKFTVTMRFKLDSK